MTDSRKAIQTYVATRVSDNVRQGVSNYLCHSEGTAHKHYRMVEDDAVATIGTEIATLVVSWSHISIQYKIAF